VFNQVEGFFGILGKQTLSLTDFSFEVWKAMSDAEKWSANQVFLDQVIDRGDTITLSHFVSDIA